MSATLLPAVIGLVGVLVGAVTNYLLAVRKEKADAVKDKLFRSNELRTAARLITLEFEYLQLNAKYVVENGEYLPRELEFSLGCSIAAVCSRCQSRHYESAMDIPRLQMFATANSVLGEPHDHLSRNAFNIWS